MKAFSLYGRTHTGKRRKDNQDTFLCTRLWNDHNALLLVVDGVGGYAGGDKAASLARTSIGDYMKIPKGDILTMLKEAVIYANNRIAEERKSNPSLSEMCCVLTAVVADTLTGTFHYVHIGDTRLYLYSNSQLQKITRDHSFVGIHEDAGELTEEEAMVHPQRNQILREVGSTSHRMDDLDFMDSGTLELNKNDVLLLCSDGLTDLVPSGTIKEILCEKTTEQIKAGKLIDKANEMGGYDNITVVLFENLHDPVSVLTEPVRETKEPSESTEQKSKSRKRSLSRWIFGCILLLIFTAGSGWYYFTQVKARPKLPRIAEISFVKSSPSQKDTPDSTPFFTTRGANPATPGPVNQNSTDTLRIKETQELSAIQQYLDSSGHHLVLMPGNKKTFPALRLNIPQDTILIRNIRFKDFENAILLDSARVLLFDNIVFENIRYPLAWSSAVSKNSSTILIMNPVKK